MPAVTVLLPLVAYFVVSAALFITLATKFVQVRRLHIGFGAWTPLVREPLLRLVATSAGLGSISGSAIAVSLGGPGALVWMWIVVLLGMAVHSVEASSASERPELEARRPSAISLAAAAILFAVASGWFQAHQAAAWITDTEPRLAPYLPVAIVLAGMLSLSVERVRSSLLGVAVPVAISAYLATALTIALRDPWSIQLATFEAWNGAFGFGAAGSGLAGGTVALAVHHGTLRAVFAAQIGLGSTTLAFGDRDRSLDPRQSGAIAMIVSLFVSGLLSTATAFLMLTAPERKPVSEPELVPLDHFESEGLRPSQRAGQTVVLPNDSGFEPGHFYAMKLLAHPRGHQVGKLFKDDNAVVLPHWAIADQVDTVVFRAREEKQAAHPGWDVRIECNREVLGTGDRQLVKLTPKASSLNFAEVIGYYELDPRPYVVVGDFHFVGQVETAISPNQADRTFLAMYEASDADRPLNPKFHELFRMGFRGPIVDDGTDEEQPSTPWALVSRKDFSPPIGSIERLRIEHDPRGNDLLRINRVGSAEAPPWKWLMAANTLVVRHRNDSTQDIYIPVTAEHDGFRVRFRSSDPHWQDFRRLEKMPDWQEPYIVVPDQNFRFEVHGDVRLPERFHGRRSLIPLDTPVEPTGPTTLLARPHPAELLAAGMKGPYRNDLGSVAISSRIRQGAPAWVHLGLFVATVVLALGSLVVWSTYAARCGAWLVSPSVGPWVGLAVLGSSAMAGLLAIDELLTFVDLAMLPILLLTFSISIAHGMRHRPPRHG